MASSSGGGIGGGRRYDEHTSLQNELIFLSNLLHQHKQNEKTSHVEHKNKLKLDQRSHHNLHSSGKKNLVWRKDRSTTSYDLNNANIEMHLSVDHRNILPTKTKYSGKYAKVNSVTSQSSSPSSSLSQSKTGNSTSSFRNEKHQRRPTFKKETKWIRPSRHISTSVPAAADHASNNLAKKSTSVLHDKVFSKQYRSLENQSNSGIVTHKIIYNLNHEDKLTNKMSDSLPLSKILNQTDNKARVLAETVLVNTPKTKDSLPKDLSVKLSPNSRYVWRKHTCKGLPHQMKSHGRGGLKQKGTSTDRKQSNINHSVSITPGTSKTKLSGAECVSKSPEKSFSSSPLKREMVVRSKYKLRLDLPTVVGSGKKRKNKRTVYFSPTVFRSPSARKGKLLTPQSMKKTPKPGTSRHRWVCPTKGSNHASHGIAKFSKSPESKNLPAPYRKSKFTWRKDQLKTKQVSVCGYKLVNIAKTPQQKQTTFMERRTKFVNSHTPVIPRSRFKLHRKQSPTISPGVKTFETIKTPSGRLVNNKQNALFTVRKTRRKIIRKQVPNTQSTGTSRLVGDQVTPVTINTKNQEFKIHSSGKKLKRLRQLANSSISSIVSVGNTPRTSIVIRRHSISSRKLVAQQVLHRSIVTSNQAKYKKHNTPTSAKRYCTYYNRFGKCSRGDKCPYLHDSEKVAVCTRFLRGNCKQTDGTCPFSHKISKDKMPVCSYFLRGICNRDNCPYLHVNVSRNAAICQDFLRGYCPAGDKCKKKHSLECPDYQRDGNCPRGRQCRLLHRQLKATKRKKEREEVNSIKKQAITENKEAEELVGKLPSFISLNDEDSDWSNTPNTSIQDQKGSVTPELLIRPKFTSH
ncbi:uncharacterized protein LOC117114912 [Anneissia japonica]|uniref:uncharacterized protein LOC117114912 n=1 Tax=Anneissia japonica TaxID=1529436 RepID=UPI0014257001|nr:uncharacterized protein LOC117114912 [Anneissia japonica]